MATPDPASPEPAAPLPLRAGDDGPAVADLHHRLQRLGYLDHDPGTRFGVVTEEAVTAFQTDRGLDATGRCDQTTWSAVVEAGYRLGDRLLYLQSPMTRGDDVSELQESLNSLGFDAGRVDGIFGPDTQAAVSEFQRNSGLPDDGIVGPDTRLALRRLGPGRTLTGSPVSVVREGERLRHLRPSGRVLVGTGGAADPLGDAVARQLRLQGLDVAVIQHPDGSEHARAANAIGADLYLGLDLIGGDESVSQYFALPTGFVSVGGRDLAERLTEALPPVLGEVALSQGMRVPVLRETRMAAVVCRVAPPRRAVERLPALAETIANVILTWLRAVDEHPDAGCPQV